MGQDEKLTPFFKAVLEQDTSAIVLCNLEDTIIYMNPAAIKRYDVEGGAELLGKSIMSCHPPKARAMMAKVVEWFKASPDHNRIYEFRNEREDKDVYMVALRDDEGTLIGYYEQHCYRSHETAQLYDFSD